MSKLSGVYEKNSAQEVRFIPARMENHRHFQKTYACTNCEKTGTHKPIIKSEVPKLPLNNTPHQLL